ncbi:hypothetical protein AGMMS50268_31510 [Spirochaetia bacterium]|nr:hypothetical protein AGMMS50268_31510 [Spirochaetia bacterium]
MKQYERLLYQTNSTPGALVMVFLVINTWQTIFTLNGVNVSEAGIRIMEIILLNIFLSFLVFVTASEVKRYSLRWSWIALGIGVFQCLRIFFISSTITGGVRLNITLSLLLSGFLLIIASLLSIGKSKKYILALKE